MLSISVVTSTYFRYKEIPGLLESLSAQTYLPTEVILVDGAPLEEKRTEEWVASHLHDFPFEIKYYRQTGGTAVQRNFGVEFATSDLIAFIDDDVRLQPQFLEQIEKHFAADSQHEIGGITGVKGSHTFNMNDRVRWRWYKYLRLLRTYEPSSYDTQCGYPINANAHPPFKGIRTVDIMSGACTLYRREIFDKHEMRFHPFFRDYGMLEDAHFALSVQKLGYHNLQCGDAICEELNSSSGRSSSYIIGTKTCLNYYFVFNSICGPLSFKQRFLFFRYQLFELIRFFFSFLKRRDKASWGMFAGKTTGIITGMFLWKQHLDKKISTS